MPLVQRFLLGFRTALDPTTLAGAILYAVLFILIGWGVIRSIRLLVDGAIRRDHRGIIDRTTVRFFVQFVRVTTYVVALTAYFHVIPDLRSLGTFLLAGVSVTSVVFGLAASNTLSNLIAGVSLLLYFPYRVGDTLRVQVAGSIETAKIESINLGYTQLRSQEGMALIVPNSVLMGTAVAHIEEG